MEEEREALRNAAKDVQQLESQLAEAKATLTRAGAAVVNAEKEVSRFAGFDSAVAEWRIQALKAGNDPRQLPVELATQKVAKADAEEEVGLSRTSHKLLEDEVGSLEARLKRLKKAHLDAAVEILYAFLCERAQEIIHLNTRISEFRLLTLAIENLLVENPEGGRYGIGIPSKAIRALEGATRGWDFPGMADPNVDTTRRWARTLRKLLLDPETPVEIAAVKPSDYSELPTRPEPFGPSVRIHLVEE